MGEDARVASEPASPGTLLRNYPFVYKHETRLIATMHRVLLLGAGKTAGISGITGNAIAHPTKSGWQWIFIAGLLGGAAIFMAMNGSLDATLPAFDAKTALAAVCVGVGTRLGTGCTSGHGVCGIGRRSVRSVTATAVFMSVAIATVAIVGV